MPVSFLLSKLLTKGLRVAVAAFVLCTIFSFTATSSAQADITTPLDLAVGQSINGIAKIPVQSLGFTVPITENSTESKSYQIADKKKKKKKKKAKKSSKPKKKANRGSNKKKKAKNNNNKRKKAKNNKNKRKKAKNKNKRKKAKNKNKRKKGKNKRNKRKKAKNKRKGKKNPLRAVKKGAKKAGKGIKKGAKKAGKGIAKTAGKAAAIATLGAAAVATLGKDAVAEVGNFYNKYGCKGFGAFLKNPKAAGTIIKKVLPGLKKSFNKSKGNFSNLDQPREVQVAAMANPRFLSDGVHAGYVDLHKVDFAGKVYTAAINEMNALGKSAINKMSAEINKIGVQFKKNGSKIVKAFKDPNILCDRKKFEKKLASLGLKPNLANMQLGYIDDEEKSYGSLFKNLFISEAHASKSKTGWQYFQIGVSAQAVQGVGLGFFFVTNWKGAGHGYFYVQRTLAAGFTSPIDVGAGLSTGWAKNKKSSAFEGEGFGLAVEADASAIVADVSCGPEIGLSSSFKFSSIGVGCGFGVGPEDAGVGAVGTVSHAFAFKMY